MEVATNLTLSKYADRVDAELENGYIVLDDIITTKDLKSPYTLIGVNCETQVFIIMRGYKKSSLIKRYMGRMGKHSISNTFFIVDVKHLELEKYKLEANDVSSKHYI